MSRWWRAYDEALHDPKLMLLSDKMFRAWFGLMCIASLNGGALPAIKVVAVQLRTNAQRAAAIITELHHAGLLDKCDDGTFEPHNWKDRQYQSDVTDPTAANRQRNYRNRKRNADRNATVTEHVTVTPPRVQKTETDSVPDGTAADAAPADIDVVDEDPKAKLFRIGKTTLISFGITEKRTGALIGQWLKSRNDPIGLLAAIQFARDHNVAEPVAYISTLMSGKGQQNGHGKQALGDLALDLADQLREQERACGIGRPPTA